MQHWKTRKKIDKSKTVERRWKKMLNDALIYLSKEHEVVLYPSPEEGD